MTKPISHAETFRTRTPAPRGVLELFLALALPLYLAFALITPAFQTPDEQQHLYRAWQLSNFQLEGEKRGDQAGGVLPGGLAVATLAELGTIEPHADKHIRSRSTWLPRSTSPDAAPPMFLNFMGAVNYSPVSYLPQIAVVGAGRTLGWSVETIILTGRVANIMLFLALFGVAIRLTPWGKPAFLFVALQPMTACSVAAFGQDGLVIGCAALLVALGLRALLSERWDRSQLVAATGVAAAIALTKFVYLPMLAAGAIAGRSGKDKARSALVILAIGLATIAIAAGWLAMLSGVRVPPVADVQTPGVRLIEFLGDPSDFLNALAGNYLTNGLKTVAGAYIFGWLNIGPVALPFYLTLEALALLLLVGGGAAKGPKPLERAWLLLVAGGTFLLVNFAVWIYYTPDGFDEVRGMQTRYLVPVLLLVLTAILPRRTSWPRAQFWMTTLMVVANLCCLIAIGREFYR